MDGHLILEFNTEIEALTCLGAINTLAEQYWTDRGYTVIDGQLIGKKNGVDAPDSARTITWDLVNESPDGTWYFSSLSNDGRFYDPGNGIDWKVVLAGMGFTAIGTEKEFPVEWIPQEEETP